MYSPSHRSSMSATSIATPPSPKQRRMSSPVPPPAPLGLPEPMQHHVLSQPNSSPSPLRKAVTLDPVTGTLSEDGSSDTNSVDPWGTRDQKDHSPSPSITQFASSFAQRVGSIVTSVSPASQLGHLPTEAELEAEAQSQREKSRREAERILTQQAVERKKVEERVLEMLEATRTRPTRSQTTPLSSGPPSPTKEGGSWWSAAMNKLTPTKDKDLTPAQQIVKDTKAREKERRKSREREWPSNTEAKHHDPAFQQLMLPPGARPPSGPVGGGANVPLPPLPPSPGSPSPRSGQPARQLTESSNAARSTMQPTSPFNVHHNNYTAPHPGKHTQSQPPTASVVPPASSGREPAPLYAQFTTQGALDISATLLTIARRFEKLERWAVGHTRALEDRMSDVEKWLVDKEREREREREALSSSSKLSTATVKPQAEGKNSSPQQIMREVTIERKTVEVDQEVKRVVGDLKEELGELRGRVGELGREISRLASSVSPHSPSEASGFGIGRIASPPAETPAQSPSLRTLPPIPAQAHTQSPSSHSIAQSETASIVSSETGASTRTKLPYPSGDYTSPLAPPSSHTPPTAQNYSANNATSAISRTRPLSYSGLPIPQTSFPSTSSPGLTRGSGGNKSPALAAVPGTRGFTSSPTPRKRYTVALGQPLSSSSSPSASGSTNDPPSLGLNEKQSDFGQPLFAEPQTVELRTAFFTNVVDEIEHLEEHDADGDDVHEEEDRGTNPKQGAELKRQETIGKTPITLSRLSLSPPPSQNTSPNNKSNLRRSSPRSSPSNPRMRAQSTYGVPGAAMTATNPSFGHGNSPPTDGKDTWRTRSRSIDRVGLGIDGLAGSTFVDPLVVRKKEQDVTSTRNSVIASPGGTRGRVPFGDLLAFFDPEKQ